MNDLDYDWIEQRFKKEREFNQRQTNRLWWLIINLQLIWLGGAIGSIIAGFLVDSFK